MNQNSYNNHNIHNIVASVMNKKIAKRLEEDPSLYMVGLKNLLGWERESSGLTPAQQEWKDIITQKTNLEILNILTMENEEGIRLRSSSPFTGVLEPEEIVSIKKSLYHDFSNFV
jgi:hypothetical protein